MLDTIRAQSVSAYGYERKTTPVFDEFAKKTGRRYDFLVPYRCEDAEYILVGMGGYIVVQL